MKINIEETEHKIKTLHSNTTNNNKKVRLEALLLKKQNPKWAHVRLAKEMNINRRTVARWLELYESGGMKEMLNVQRMGSRIRKILDEQQQQALKIAIEQGNVKTYQEARFWILKEANIALQYKNTCMFVSKQMGISLRNSYA